MFKERGYKYNNCEHHQFSPLIVLWYLHACCGSPDFMISWGFCLAVSNLKFYVSFSLFLYDSMLSHSIDSRYVQGVSWSNGGGQKRAIVCLDEEQV